MTTTPMEPESDPQIVPSGEPGLDPIDPGEVPGPLEPQADPQTRPDGGR